MRLTTHTDYTLRVMIYLTVQYQTGNKATIPEIAKAYGISRNHLMKIVHQLSLGGFVSTVRGRNGGITLSNSPEKIKVGDVIRFSEQDFSMVECHVSGAESDCVVWGVCNLQVRFRRAVDAFLRELDQITMADAVSSVGDAASLLHISGVPIRTVGSLG